VSWFLAGTLYREGRRFGDPALERDGLSLGHSLYYQIYQNLANGFAFDIPEGWGETTTDAYNAAGYLRPRSVWELLDAIKTPR
jgi:hypothetical protein